MSQNVHYEYEHVRSLLACTRLPDREELVKISTTVQLDEANIEHDLYQLVNFLIVSNPSL